MNREAQDKLRLLRQRLAELEPYPWDNVGTWIALASSLIRAQYAEHCEDFKAVTATPKWDSGIYGSTRSSWDEPPRDNIAEEAARVDRENRKRANAAKQKILSFIDGLLDLPMSTEVKRPDPSVLHHHGDIIMGTKNISTVTDSTVGNIVLGKYANVTGAVNIGPAAPLTQDQHRAAITEAQKALFDDQDRLEPLIFEALGQFLRIARDIQVEQKSLAEVQAKIDAALEEVLIQHAVNDMKPQILSKTLEVVKVLGRSTVMGEVVKKLVEP